ncbi:hypothetical protein XccvBFoX7_gp58c [Xanthomonas phage FoX7]|uniref:Uncharacterized protein n=2 Tax=Carpasinavirus XcP1 TaxID=2182344 RepID=A0A858NR05_9CAUD|nr:hypothetical protein XccvBFoX6_gp58c [Xanthomonas phage FoX6]QJB22215.1 hypothetical protein XccvBFoX7_gp58c [Xanthomonas phage FoX7]
MNREQKRQQPACAGRKRPQPSKRPKRIIPINLARARANWAKVHRA